jgi:acetolactate synthase-1/2/3 large subunit
MKASDYIAQFLEQRGVHTVFELSGGMITHLLDSFAVGGKIKCVSMHHEQGAAFAADAMGRMTGVPGVALATSGPGATNLLTGIGSCYFDSSPAVFLTGQVNRHEQKGDRAIRQLGFQETDIVSMAKPITKAAWRVASPEELPALLNRAFDLAVEGRPGPVLVDVPMDVQRSNVEPATPSPSNAEPARADAQFSFEQWSQLFKQLNSAERPLILVGGGIHAGRVAQTFVRFAEQAGIPVVNSLMAMDVLPFDHPLRVGMIGSYGNRWGNLAIGKSDFMLVLGSRLDVRQTGSEIKAFKAQRTIYHVDCEAGEINNRVTGCEPVLSTLKDFLEAAVRMAPKFQFRDRSGWLGEIAKLRAQWPDDKELTGIEGINPNRLMHAIARASKRAAAYVVDVGQHQMWAAQSLELQPSQRFLTSGGMGSMGFSLPAAVGTAFAAPGRPIVLIAGDGGFQCNIQELQTVVRNGLPIKLIVVNNRCHGMVRQFQEAYFDKRYQSTLWGYSAPDFEKVAAAYGIDAKTIADESEIDAALRWMWSDPQTPALLHVMVDTTANAYPKIAFGHPITEMEPFAKPLDMEGT